MCKVSVSVDKEYTSVAQYPFVKDKARDIRAAYTAGDFMRLYNNHVYAVTPHDQPGNYLSGDILKCDVSVFPDNALFLNSDCTMAIEVITYETFRFTRLRFYLKEDGSIRDDLITYERYEKV